MPLKDGRLYTDAANKLGISAAEVAQCLGISSLDMGTQCTSAKINMWSRKKPVHINHRAPNRVTEWWKGSEGDCGVKPPTRVSTFAAVKALYDGGLNGWSHTRPSLYYRRMDFDGYYHYAEPQIRELDVPADVIVGNTIPASVGIREDDRDSSGSGSLNMDEITVDNIALSNWYVGIALFEGSTLRGWIAEHKGLTMQQYEYPTDSSMIGKTYTVVPFYSKVYLSKDSGVSIDGALMPLPVLQPMQVKVNSTAILISIGAEAIWASDKMSISFTVTALNEGSSSLTFTTATARLRFIENATSVNAGWVNGMQAGEYEFNLLNYGLASTISAGAEDTTNVISQSIGSSYRDKTYVLLVRLYGGGINFDYGPEEVPEDESEVG